MNKTGGIPSRLNFYFKTIISESSKHHEVPQ